MLCLLFQRCHVSPAPVRHVLPQRTKRKVEKACAIGSRMNNHGRKNENIQEFVGKAIDTFSFCLKLFSFYFPKVLESFLNYSNFCDLQNMTASDSQSFIYDDVSKF